MPFIRCSAGLATAVLAAPFCPALADELHVPSQYPTIAAAVAASQAGDEIVLADGRYTGDGNYDITMPGHVLTLRSASGNLEACGIWMRDPLLFPPERALIFSEPGSSGTVVRGIGIVNGSGRGLGGGVLIQGSSPIFEDCLFAANWASGEACSHSVPSGGGVYLDESSAVFERCVFSDNSAYAAPCSGTGAGRGGGVYVGRGAPMFLDCRFERNAARGDVADDGGAGGMYVSSGGNVLLVRTLFEHNGVSGGIAGRGFGGALYTAGGVEAIDCDFIDNEVNALSSIGGAIAVQGGELELMNCKLIGNEVVGQGWNALGGALYASAGRTTITNCLIAENEADEFPWCEPEFTEGAYGGALCLSGTAAVTVRSSTLVGNSSGGRWGVPACGGDAAFLLGAQTLDITNCIVWGRGEQPFGSFEPGATIQIAFSDIEGGWPGEGNIDADPMFVDPAVGDYRLSAGSPAADAGASDLVPPDTFDLDGDGDISEPLPLDLAFAPRFTDDPAAPDTGRGAAPIVDMGAYETVVDGCYADCDGSGDLDFFDFLCFQNAFAAGQPYADCDGSGAHDFFDFLCFQNAFAAGCP